MARKTVVTYTCDLTGGSAVETVQFGLDNRRFEIDLTEVLAKELRDALAPYLEVARRVRSGKAVQGATPARPDSEQLRAIRVWARANGHQVADRGRIPKKVLTLFNAAH